MTRITGNEPAQPTTISKFDRENPTGYDLAAHGLTIRQHFAGLAMQGILASSADRGTIAAAKMAVEFSDALIAELNKEATT